MTNNFLRGCFGLLVAFLAPGKKYTLYLSSMGVVRDRVTVTVREGKR